MRIAIVGSGIAGLACAHLLARRHQVQVFEAAERLGGHTHTVTVELDGQRYAVDTGFIVFNDWTYPNFIRLLEQLGVASQPTEMSFSVQDPLSSLEYNGHNLNTLFAQRRNLLSPGFIGMLRDILRFNRQAPYDLEQGLLSTTTTLGDYLRAGNYGQRFIDHYIVPMGAAIWSMPLASMLEFPLYLFVRFFRNHGLLSVNQRPQWRVIKGGSSAYLPALTKPFHDTIQLNCPVRTIRRDAKGVTLISVRGEERFDKVVLACHSDQALALLEQPSQAEQSILGAIPYADNDVVLHTDTRLLPRNRRAWASWNYRLSGNPAQPAAVTYDMNRLQGIQASHTFCVSLNQTGDIAEDKILGRFRYAHPQFSLASQAAQARWQELLGVNHTYFCGAYWANGFHEDAVVSALRVAADFGEQL